jgi:hypothetical protein
VLNRVERATPAAASSVLTKSAQRTEVDVQILVGEPEGFLELLHSLVQLQERKPKSFDLLVRQSAAIHATNGLMLQNFPEQFYHGQYESRKAVFDMFRVSVDAIGEGARKRFERDFRGRPLKSRFGIRSLIARTDAIVALTHRGSGC